MLKEKIFRRVSQAFAFVAFTLLILSASAFAQQPVAVPHETPPPPTAPRTVKFPVPQERTLSNGLRVVVVERHTTPITAARLIIKTGGEADPTQLPGLADMTASLLTKGTATRKAPQIAEAIEALGGSIESGAGWDASRASVDVEASKLSTATAILADVIRNPVFEDEEIERLRQQYLDDLRVALGTPNSIARYVASRVVFGDEPYGHPLSGTLESVARIKRDDIIKFHQTYYRPDNAVLIIGGDVTAAEGFRLAEKLFGDWQKPAAPLLASAARNAAADAKPRVVVVDKPDAGQAAVIVARTGISRRDQDYVRGIVANSVLNG
jgi:zinc protease